MIDEDLKDDIQALIDRIYHENDKASMRVGLIQQYLNQVDGWDVSRNEVEVACDKLTGEDRLVLIKDSGRSGRRYCSTDVPKRKIHLLKDGVD